MNPYDIPPEVPMTPAFMIVMFLVWTALIVGYLLPTIIAASRQHPHTAPIVVVNLLLGWTLLGYVVALAWSVMTVRQDVLTPPKQPLE